MKFSTTHPIYSPNSLCCRGSGGVSSTLGICPLPISSPCVRGFLCAGAVNGDGHVAPVHAKVVACITFAETNVYENTYFASKLSLASWFPPLLCGVVDASPPGSTSNPIIQSKSSHEQGIEIITFVGEQWSHKGCPKLEERDKDRSKITKQTGLEHVRMKVTKSVHIDAL